MERFSGKRAHLAHWIAVGGCSPCLRFKRRRPWPELLRCRSLIFGPSFSPRAQLWHRSAAPRRRQGRPPWSADALEDHGERRPRHRHLGELEDHACEALTSMAERLAGNYPAGGQPAPPRLVEGILEWASNRQYAYACPRRTPLGQPGRPGGRSGRDRGPRRLGGAAEAGARPDI